MRFGIGSYTLAWAVGVPGFEPDVPLTPFDLLQEAIRVGADALQICDNLPLETLAPDDLDRLLAECREADVMLEPGTRGIDETLLTHHLEIAQRSGCEFVRLVIDRGEDRPSASEAVVRLRALHDRFLRAGVKIAIENHDRFPAQTLAEMVEDLGPDAFGITLDTANSLGCLEGTRHVIETLAPYTICTHVKDVRVTRAPSMMGFSVEGTPAGRGQIDIPELLRRTNPLSATLELWTPMREPGVAPVPLEREWFEDSWPTLRGIIEGLRTRS